MVSIKDSSAVLETAADLRPKKVVDSCNGIEQDGDPEEGEEEASPDRKLDDQQKLCPSLQDNIHQIALSIEEDSEFERSLKSGQTSPSLPNSPGSKSTLCCETVPEETTTTSDMREDEKREAEDAQAIELRFLVRRREAGALIGKKGCNIKRLRDTFRSSIFSIPDTGNGPERVVCIVTDDKSLDLILTDFTQLLMEKSPENDEQIELKLLIHSSHAGSIIGIGGQSIKKLRNDSKAAIKIYEMCCPLSNERVCAIKAKPAVVVKTIRLIRSIFNENPIKGTIKPYDALNFDLNLLEKYGGYSPEDAIPIDLSHLHHNHHHHRHPSHPSHQSITMLPYPAYIARVPVRHQFNFNGSQRHPSEQHQQGSRELALAKGYLSTGQNFSIWRAAANESNCPVEASEDSVMLTGTSVPPEVVTSSGRPTTGNVEETKHPSAEALTPRLVMLKPRVHNTGFPQNGKTNNFGPINNHNLTGARMNPYARSYPPTRPPRNQLFSFSNNNNNNNYLQHQQNQHQQRYFQRHFDPQQPGPIDDSSPVELIEATGRCRQRNDARPYLCMFYPSLAAHQQPYIHHRPTTPAASIRPRLQVELSSQQLSNIANQSNWNHQIHYVHSGAPIAVPSQNNPATRSLDTLAAPPSLPVSSSSSNEKN